MGRTGRSCHRAPPRRRLAEGELSGRLPTEPSLAADYRVSRQTVREAIRRLREAGQLTAERGRGTFVRAAAAASPATGTEPGDPQRPQREGRAMIETTTMSQAAATTA